MPIVSVYEAKAHLSRLIAEVERTGQSLVICRNGKPVVDIIPHRSSKDPLELDPELQGAVFHEDPCAPVSQGEQEGSQ